MQKNTTHVTLRAILFCIIALISSSKAMAGGGPHLVLKGADSVYVNQGSKYVDSGANAFDSLGNPLSNTSLVTTQTPKFNKLIPGTYLFTYNYTDSKGLKASPIHRVVIVTKDKLPPVIVINGVTDITILIGTKFKDPGVASVQDELDGDVSGTLVTSNNVNTSVVGDYHITYSDSDASGNKVTVVRYVHVVPYTYTISGSIAVSGSSGYMRHAKVYLIKYDSIDSTLTAIQTKNLNNSGSFSFTPTIAGDYLVKAALDSIDSSYASFLPTYYGDVTTWSSATDIHLTANTTITINMVSGTNAGGPGFISGKVSQGANKVGDPIPGLLIILNNKAGKAVAYTYSGKNGDFSFKNMAYGEYALSGEQFGKKIISGAVVLDAQNPQQTKINISVNSMSVVTTVEKNSSGIGTPTKSLSNPVAYPNPANNKLYIKTDGQLIHAIAIYNAAGQVVQSANYAGDVNVELNTDKLANGIYFLSLNYNTGVSEKMMISIVH